MSDIQASELTIDHLCRALRPFPQRSWIDRFLAWPMWIGLGLLGFTVLGGWIAVETPSASPHLKTAVYWSFWPGLMLVCTSWIMTLVSLVIGLRATVSTRFERNHQAAMDLSRKVADHVTLERIGEQLRSVRLELVLNARAPEKLPIATGLIATLAAGARFIMQFPVDLLPDAFDGLDAATSKATALKVLAAATAGLVPELAGIVFGVALGGFAARAVIYDTQDRLLRTESLLERAEALVLTAPPPKGAQAVAGVAA